MKSFIALAKKNFLNKMPIIKSEKQIFYYFEENGLNDVNEDNFKIILDEISTMIELDQSLN